MRFLLIDVLASFEEGLGLMEYDVIIRKAPGASKLNCVAWQRFRQRLFVRRDGSLPTVFGTAT